MIVIDANRMAQKIKEAHSHNQREYHKIKRSKKMQVIKSNGRGRAKFQNQKWFNDFNWQNFVPGDLVWLEDYEDKTKASQDYIAGVFVTSNESEVIIKMLTKTTAARLAPLDIENVTDPKCSELLALYNNHVDWQHFLETF